MGERTAELRISGMTCAMCAKAIEDSLGGREGVNSAEVNLASETARVTYDPEKVGMSDLEAAVSDVGYSVVNDRVTLRIGGMTCAMCVKALEGALGALDGVSTVSINLAAEKAYVSYNSRVTSVVAIRKAIEDTGYQFLGVEGEVSDTAEKEARDRELAARLNRATVGFIFGGILMAMMYLPVNWPVELHYIMLAVSVLPFIYVSQPIFSAGFKALRIRNLNMDVMYSMGIGVAFGASILGTFGIVLTHEFMFYESAVFLAAFLMLGRYLEARAKGRTSDAIKKLVGLQAKTALVLRGGKEIQVPVEDVTVGDVVIVRPGERVPVDGRVLEGSSYVDEAMVTGEPVPALKTSGSQVVGGTINRNGVLRISAERVGKDTMLAQIIRMVEEAQGSKPPVQRLADRAVGYFIPVVLTIAVSAFLLWYLWLASASGVDNVLLFSLTVLISILVIACPCALGLATPTAVTVGIGRGAELGMLVRNGESLELAEAIDTVVFDKTGTITVGRPDVTDILAFGHSENGLLAIAASVEKYSQHPLAEAVVRKAGAQGAAPQAVEGFDTVEGKGVSARVSGKNVLVGSQSFLSGQGIALDGAEEGIDNLEKAGKTVALVGVDGKLAGVLGISDAVKPSAKAAIALLRDMGIDVVMITGDNQRTAEAVARQVGIERVVAGVLPGDKAREVARLQTGGKKVAFVGDGINDAPALARADVGITVGSGTDIAIESGDIVLVRGDLLDVAGAIQLSKKVMGRIRQNLFWAFAYNGALIPVAAGLLYPLYGMTLRPELAGLAMALSSVTVISLSLMLRGFVPPARSG